MLWRPLRVFRSLYDPGLETSDTPRGASPPSGGRVVMTGIAAVAHRRGWLVLALLLGLTTWPIIRLTPMGGIDGSWQAAMVMAIERGLRWGVDVVFTYGPLGFLSVPQLYSPVLGAMGWAFVGLAHLAVCGAIVWLSFRRENRWVGLLLAIVGALLVAPLQPTTALVVLSMTLAAALLLRDHTVTDDRRLTIGVVVIASIAALTLTIKFNDGVAAVAILGAVCIGLPRPRRHLLVGASAVTLSTVILWLLSGQALPDLPLFLIRSAEVASGYSSAVGIDEPSRDWQFAAVAIGAVMVGAAIWTQTRQWSPRSRIAVALMIAAVCFLAYKQAFVRHGGGGFFEMLAIASVWILPWDRASRGHRLLLMAALVLAAMGVSRAVPTRFFDVAGPGTVVEQAMTVASTPERIAAIDDGRRAMRREYDIPADLLDAIGDRPVHIWPYETGVAWAYPDLAWTPLPMVQAYLAYTDGLDGLDASALASPTGPEVILSHAPATIDGRAPYLEAPDSALELVCRYAEIAGSDRWQLLERRSSTCGERRDLGTRTFEPGEFVTVPEDPGRIVVASIEGVESNLGSRFRALLSRSATWQIGRTGIGFGRLVPGRADGPLLMSVPPSLAWSERFTPASTTAFTAIRGPTRGVADEVQPDVAFTVRFTSIAFDR